MSRTERPQKTRKHTYNILLMEDRKIRVGITHGDTNGAGYEQIFKIFADPEMLELCTPIIYGSPKVAAYHRKALGVQANFSIVATTDEVEDGRVNLLTSFEEDVKVDLGEPTAESGAAALKSLDRALTDLRDGAFDVLVCCPVCNDNIHIDGRPFTGLKRYIEVSVGEGHEAVSLLLNDTLRIASATDALAVKDVPGALTADRLTTRLNTLVESMRRDFRISNPRVAVLQLNPGGHGTEEKEAIVPAVAAATGDGTHVFGPYAPEKYFGEGQFDAFDCTLALYDDQARIPFSTLTADPGIYFLAGLPSVCLIPTGGAGFDTVGKGTADESSLRRAIFVGIDIFRHREEYAAPYADPLQKLYHERRDESEKVRFSIPKKRDAAQKKGQAKDHAPQSNEG